ncbi:MAG TPA: matrixin family metalloprotease [Candidatus Polarisedimenticolaceae bacterium]|nr:matrixin family metalloprotease [Candidatus Polarisedimenticolaceae bacterium]
MNPRARLLLACCALAAGLPARGALSVYLAPEQLAERVPLVVEGEVVRTASGYDPLRRTLATYVTLAVDQVHRGPQDLDELVLRELGGRYGELVHEVDAVPAYAVGEHVLAFLEPGPDGSLHTSGMFFGKFRLEADAAGAAPLARRELEGSGRILGRGLPREERLSRADLLALVATTRPEAASFHARPPEYARLEWDGVEQLPGSDVAAPSTATRLRELAPAASAPEPAPSFVPLSASYPTRWEAAAAGTPISVNIQPANNPLNDAAAAVAQLQRAFDAWTAVPEARVALQAGNTNYNYTGTKTTSPADAYTGATNVILFGDPYQDISDPVGCSGVLAIGGYWRSGTASTTVNGVTFYPALQLYVIFNNGFECYLSNPDNLAEVATHELGHGLGFGHSATNDAIMRATAYGGRGPRLGDDDRDGAHCHYPHTLTVTRPNGGESWPAGSVQTIQWTTTAEAGPDAGTVDLEYSTDGGTSWKPVAAGTPNDGAHSWVVPPEAGSNVRVRVLHPNRISPAPAPYPAACSSDRSNASFTITAAAPVAGTIPALVVNKAAAGQLRLSWDSSCSAEAVDHAVYEGDLDQLRAGVWNHLPRTCAAGVDLAEYVAPAGGNTYYLVAPLTATHEGTLGWTSSGALRPGSTSACHPRESATTCN